MAMATARPTRPTEAIAADVESSLAFTARSISTFCLAVMQHAERDPVAVLSFYTARVFLKTAATMYRALAPELDAESDREIDLAITVARASELAARDMLRKSTLLSEEPSWKPISSKNNLPD
jgi:hypothetical protein